MSNEASGGGGGGGAVVNSEAKGEAESDQTIPDVNPNAKKDRNLSVLESLGLIIGKALGQGSYAIVRQSYDVKRKEHVAIKIISRRKAPDDYLAKFLPREIEILKMVRHPALVKFFQVIETTNRFYIVMEMASNGDLLDTVRHSDYIEENRARYWFQQLTDGLAYMHSKGVAHRDIKCENLLLDTKFDLKVTDFGFARKFQSKNLSETFCGSYAYAPPEILKGIPYDAFVAEVWSMGVVLYTMVFGRLPFDDSDLKRLLRQVQGKVVFPNRPANVTDDCKKFICKMLDNCKERILMTSIPGEKWYRTPNKIPEDGGFKKPRQHLQKETDF